MNLRNKKQIDFLSEIDKFKEIQRRVYITKGKRRENDAEHAWHLAMFLIIFEKEIPKKANRLKMLKMVLTHDLVEIYAGDTFAHDNEGRKTKPEREKKAAKKLFRKLPSDLEKEFWKLFKEYEAGKTLESKVVHSYDKLQPILQNILSGGKAWKKHKITLQEVDDYKRHFMLYDKNIKRIYLDVLQMVRDKKIAYKNEKS